MAGENLIQSASPGRNRLRNAARIAIFAAFIFLSLSYRPLPAQTVPDITGNWQGSVEAGRGFRIILQISAADQGRAGNGAWQGAFYAMGVGARESDVSSVMLEGSTLRFTIPPEGSFEGKLGADGKSITGTLKYGGASYALTLARATADTAWAVPKPTDHMPADAAPEFEVATIKPTDPNQTSRGFMSEGGRRIFCENETADDIISFAYGVHVRQIVGGPAWLNTDKYDVDGFPDVMGQPNLEQMRDMYRSLLTSRFNLTLHHETRELSAYVVRVGKNGPKLSKSLGDPKGMPDQTFTHWTQQLMELKETNATMAEFSSMLAWALQRPVVDQTGLADRYDFTLKWTPDGAPVEDPNAPPGIFVAIEEQIGLKVDATKAPVDVLVIDHVDGPSPN